MSWVLVLLALTVGSAAGWLGSRWHTRRASAASSPSGRSPAPVLSDPPELAWIARANGAEAIWLRRSDRGSIAEFGATGAVETDLHEAVVARLSAAAGGSGRTDVERIEAGILAFVASEDYQAAILLPDRQPVPQAQRDLELLIGLIRTRDTLEEAAAPEPGTEETLRGLALRLALDLERLVDAEVAIAIRKHRGAQVIATSPRADPHLQRIQAVPGSAVDLAVHGQVSGVVMAYDPFGVLPPDRRLRERRAFVFPIQGKEGETLGALAVWPPSGIELIGPRKAEAERYLRLAGPRMGEAMLRNDLAERAVRDPLTGLHNRRGLQEAMARVEPRAGSLIVLDLDHFKKLNDSLGHPAGDAALQAVAGILEDAVRGAADTAARIGGEEFAVWLPETGLVEARAVAERLRSKVAELNWSWQNQPWPLTGSLGVAAWPETTRSRENLFPQADAALYQAKAGGRNRVEVAASA